MCDRTESIAHKLNLPIVSHYRDLGERVIGTRHKRVCRMSTERYTPGHSHNATDFMAQRTLQSHGRFFLPWLTPGCRVLDCGCGPGSITLGIAERVAPATVVGVDGGASQVERAAADAAAAGISNAQFQAADCRELPFLDASFDRVFSHALLEHLARPEQVIAELRRVLQPGGVIGVCSPDWGGFLLAPPSLELTQAVDAYKALQGANGGDVHVGRKLGQYLEGAGFAELQMSARYECYPSLTFIGEYLALQLDEAGDSGSAESFRAWSRKEGGLFAQCWVSCTAHKVA